MATAVVAVATVEAPSTPETGSLPWPLSTTTTATTESSTTAPATAASATFAPFGCGFAPGAEPGIDDDWMVASAARGTPMPCASAGGGGAAGTPPPGIGCQAGGEAPRGSAAVPAKAGPAEGCEPRGGGMAAAAGEGAE
ncbi:MAG: hypothetical protein QM820_48175 [Minicystis sp.]